MLRHRKCATQGDGADPIDDIIQPQGLTNGGSQAPIGSRSHSRFFAQNDSGGSLFTGHVAPNAEPLETEDDAWASLQEAAGRMRASELVPEATPFVPSVRSGQEDPSGPFAPSAQTTEAPLHPPAPSSMFENFFSAANDVLGGNEFVGMAALLDDPMEVAAHTAMLADPSTQLLGSDGGQYRHQPRGPHPTSIESQQQSNEGSQDSMVGRKMPQYQQQYRVPQDQQHHHNHIDNGWSHPLPQPRPAAVQIAHRFDAAAAAAAQASSMHTGGQQLNQPPSPDQWGHIQDEALAFTDEIEEEDNLALQQYQEQQEREKEKRRQHAIEKQREKEQVLEAARIERNRRAEEQRREAQELKERKRREEVAAAERQRQQMEAMRESQAQEASEQQAKKQKQRTREDEKREHDRVREDEKKRERLEKKKELAKQAVLQREAADKEKEREAEEARLQLERKAEQRAAHKEEAAQRARLEKEAAEARRQARKEAAAKKQLDEREEAERRRQAKRQAALKAEWEKLQDERCNMEKRVLEKLAEYEKVGALVDAELVRLDRLMLTLGITIDSEAVQKVIGDFPENAQKRLQRAAAAGGRSAFGAGALGALFSEESEYGIVTGEDVRTMMTGITQIVHEALVKHNEAALGLDLGFIGIQPRDKKWPEDRRAFLDQLDREEALLAQLEKDLKERPGEVLEQRAAAAAADEEAQRHASDVIGARMLRYGRLEVELWRQRQVAVEAQVALSGDETPAGKELDTEEGMAVEREAVERAKVQAIELMTQVETANATLAEAASCLLVACLCEEGLVTAKQGHIQEASDTFGRGLALSDECLQVCSTLKEDDKVQEAREKLCIAAGVANLALKFAGERASATAYKILMSTPEVGAEEAAMEKEVVGSAELAAEVCFQRALHEHELHNTEKAMRLLIKAVHICPDCLLWGGDVGVTLPTPAQTTADAPLSSKRGSAETADAAARAAGLATLGWGPLERPLVYSMVLVLLAALEFHVAAFGGSLCLLMFAWCKVCRRGGADFFTWVQGLSVLCLLWGLAVLAFLYGCFIWIAVALYLGLGGLFAWLWDSSLSLNQQLQDEGENTTISVIKRVLASTDHYTTLGILQTADHHRIKEAYSTLHRLLSESRVMLPDMKDAVKKVERAAEVLGDPTERKAYDKLLSAAAAHGVGGFPAAAPGSNVWDPSTPHGSHMLACGVCGKAHRRVLVDRDPRHARWCPSCHTYHEAFIGDGWAETDSQAGSYLFSAAFSPTEYYVCMEDGIFQVTEWAKCQKIVIEPNTHRVPFTITTNPHQNGKAKVPTADPKVSKKAARNCGPAKEKKKPRSRR